MMDDFDWTYYDEDEPLPTREEEKRKILRMLHTRIYINAEGRIRIEGWFGKPAKIDVGISDITKYGYSEYTLRPWRFSFTISPN